MKTLKALFAEVLDVKPKEITLKTAAKDISSWDSVTNLILLSEIEKEYKISISIEEVYKLQNIGDVLVLLKKKNSKIHF